MPKVSVIVPNYNYSKYLPQRLESILNQTYQDFEVIILDDCSTDNSKEVIERYRRHPKVSRIIYNEVNSGSPFLQWEKGIEMAQGEYIWIAEADDVAAPTLIEELIKPLDADPQIRLSMAMSTIIDSDGKDIYHKMNYEQRIEDGQTLVFDGNSYIVENLLERNNIYNASMLLFRRDAALNNTRREHLQMRYVGDWLYWIGIISDGKLAEVHKRLNYFRRHTQCVSEETNGITQAAIEIFIIKCVITHTALPIGHCKSLLCRYYIYRDYRRGNKEFKEMLHSKFNIDRTYGKAFSNDSTYRKLWCFKHLIYPVIRAFTSKPKASIHRA